MLKWYEIKSQEDEIVISSRIRLARNLENLPFKNKMTQENIDSLNNSVKMALENGSFGENGFDFIYLDSVDDMEQLALVEKHLISHNFVDDYTNKLVAITKDNSISIMVNEEDHIRIQVLKSGLDLKNAWDICDKVDDLLDQQVKYAFNERLGYLTACPSNLGTGLRASVMLHLPALEKANMISQLISAVGNMGLTIRGTYGEGTRAVGAVYQLSNQVTLGISEKEAIKNLEEVVMQIIESEKITRKELIKNDISIVDQIYRSYGILTNAILMSSNEFYEHISNVRLGISEGILNDIEISKVNRLINLVGTASICIENKKSLSAKERDIARAELIKSTLK